MRGEEKWSTSRAVKVVSLANETNIRADRVDKRRAWRARRSRKTEKRKRGEERERGASSGPILKTHGV